MELFEEEGGYVGRVWSVWVDGERGEEERDSSSSSLRNWRIEVGSVVLGI